MSTTAFTTKTMSPSSPMPAASASSAGSTPGNTTATAAKPHMMTATWHLKDPPLRMDEKVPYYPVWRQHLWIFPRATAPLVAHYAFMKLTGWTIHPVAAFFFYVFSFKMFAVASVQKFNRLALRYGYFDGMSPRDGISDTKSRKVLLSLLGTISIRPLFALCVAYDRHELPSLSLWFPVQLAAYACVLDFYFYWYHRLMHEVPWLWKHHQTHHKTKHPNPLLSAFADEEQEWGDILIIPLLTWLTMPVTFNTWWMCTAFILYTEAMGHSGVRLYWQTPTTGPFLRPFNMDLCLADHDAHHSRGWKKSGNYGKQTHLWDTLFGTKMERTE